MRRNPNYHSLDDTMSGTAPEPVNPGGTPEQDRILTSSGESPTGGIPIGGEADRIQPSDWARKHGSAANVLEHEE